MLYTMVYDGVSIDRNRIDRIEEFDKACSKAITVDI